MFLKTYTGKHFFYNKNWPEQIDIIDIARGLSHTCRFSGQTKNFYSVAQHSVECSLIVPPEHALEALLHDATEAYCGDLTTPLKELLPDYQKIEANIDFNIRFKFGLPLVQTPIVKHCDLIMLATERRDILKDFEETWPLLVGIECLEKKICPLQSNIAFKQFMDRYKELVGK